MLSMNILCEEWNITTRYMRWADRKVLFVVNLAKVLWWLKVHYIFAMIVAPQVAMREASQMWQVFFPSQTLHVFFFFLSQNLQIFGLALRKKAQYVVVIWSIEKYNAKQVFKFLSQAKPVEEANVEPIEKAISHCRR